MCACMPRLSRRNITLVFVCFPAGFYGQLGLGDYASTESPKELCIGYQPCYVSCLYQPSGLLAWLHAWLPAAWCAGPLWLGRSYPERLHVALK
jgi:hypothetical protein